MKDHLRVSLMHDLIKLAVQNTDGPSESMGALFGALVAVISLAEKSDMLKRKEDVDSNDATYLEGGTEKGIYMLTKRPATAKELAQFSEAKAAHTGQSEPTSEQLNSQAWTDQLNNLSKTNPQLAEALKRNLN